MKRCSSKYRSLSWWYHSTPQITNSGLYFRPLFFIPKYFHFTVIILLLNRVNKNTCVRASLFTVHPGILNTIVVSHLELSSLQIPSKALDRLQRCMSRASCQGSHPHHALAAHHPHPHPSLLAPAQVEYLVWMPLCLIYIFFNLYSVLYLSDLSHSHYVCGPPRWGPAHHFPLKSADHVGHSLCGGWVLCSTCSPWLVLFPLFTSSINTSIYIKW